MSETLTTSIKAPDLNHITATHPFQVSGHGALLKLPDGKVCKPLIERELSFYQDLHNNQSLVPFVSPFYGSLELQIPKEKVQNWIEEIQIAEESVEELNTISEGGANPWSLRISKKTLLNLMGGKNQDSFIARYLVLGDLTNRFKHPSICDIKIGTRQYGDDAAPDKRSRHMKKCSETTSSQMGVRLCGQVIWHPSTKNYARVDKYEGRSMTSEMLLGAISNYFWNGTRHRLRVLAAMTEKLRNLLQVVQTELPYRLYSSSLLLIYEGSEDAEEIVDVEIRMIDFAHAFPRNGIAVNDDGYVFGLKNLISILDNLYEKFHSPLLFVQQ